MKLAENRSARSHAHGRRHTATVPGMRRLEGVLHLLPDTTTVVVAVVGPRRRRWPREVAHSMGERTSDLDHADAVVPSVALDSQTGPVCAPPTEYQSLRTSRPRGEVSATVNGHRTQFTHDGDSDTGQYSIEGCARTSRAGRAWASAYDAAAPGRNVVQHHPTRQPVSLGRRVPPHDVEHEGRGHHVEVLAGGSWSAASCTAGTATRPDPGPVSSPGRPGPRTTTSTGSPPTGCVRVTRAPRLPQNRA